MTDQVGRTGYFDAAYRLLSAHGYGALGLRPLCTAMGVSTGGFYHWFPRWAAFTDALLADWRARRTLGVAQLAAAVPDPVARLETLAASTMSLDPRTEAAIRAWGQVEPWVGEVVADVDAGRLAVVRRAMEDLVGPGEAERFTQWGYAVLLGYEQLAVLVDQPDLAWALDRVLKSAQTHRSSAAKS